MKNKGNTGGKRKKALERQKALKKGQGLREEGRIEHRRMRKGGHGRTPEGVERGGYRKKYKENREGRRRMTLKEGKKRRS